MVKVGVMVKVKVKVGVMVKVKVKVGVMVKVKVKVGGKVGVGVMVKVKVGVKVKVRVMVMVKVRVMVMVKVGVGVMNLLQEEKEVLALHSKINLLKDMIKREEVELKKTTTALEHTVDAQEILQHLAQAVQQQAHQKISGVVSSCLSTVFDDPYAFKIVFERKRGRTEATLRFLRRDLEVDPLTASGGGVVDVAAFALRVACLVLYRPRLSRVVVLDEPFRFVSMQYQENVRQMLEQLSTDMNIQIVQVTHNPNLTTGKVIDLS